jgi:hypothetical protein
MSNHFHCLLKLNKHNYFPLFLFFNFNKKKRIYFLNLNYMGIGDWGLGIGDWGLGIGPNPQSPIPNPHSPIPIDKKTIYFKL